MLNFTVGPVQMDKETKKIGKNEIPYFRTAEFSALMKENESLLLNFFDAPQNSRCIFLTGSGTASMEACVMNFFNSEDKVLVVNGGSFGHRLVELCTIHDINFTEIKLIFGQPLTKDILSQYEGQNYSGMMLQLCETSTGILYDMNMVGDFCKRNNIFLMVDAVSGFMADELSMKKMNVNVAITGSQKALSLPPSMSFIAADETAVLRCQNNNPKSMYFDLKDYLKNGERGQTPFTPAVATLIMLNEKLKRMEKEGGIAHQNQIIAEKAAYFRSKLSDLPLEIFTPADSTSNCVTALHPTNGQSANEIFQIIKDKYKIWICPNGGELKDTVFRVGHIGNVTKHQLDVLVKVLTKVLK